MAGWASSIRERERERGTIDPHGRTEGGEEKSRDEERARKKRERLSSLLAVIRRAHELCTDQL